MPKITTLLTNTELRKFKTPVGKPLIKAVGGCTGLDFVKYHVTGTMTFRIRVKDLAGKVDYKKVGDFDNKESIDNLTVEQARDKGKLMLTEHQKFLVSPVVSVNPNELTANSLYSAVAEAWLERYRNLKNKPSANSIIKHKSALNTHILPKFGHMKYCEVTRKECYKFLEEVEKLTVAGASADNCRKTMNLISTYAQDFADAVFVNLKGIIHYDEKNNWVDLPDDCRPNYLLCDKIISPLMRLACKLHHHVFVRSGETTTFDVMDENGKVIEVLSAEWSEIDYEKNIWKVNPLRMKMKEDHWIPLTAQALRILGEIKYVTRHLKENKFIFPNLTNPEIPISSDLLATTFRRNKIGYRPKDCRTMAGDWLKANVEQWLVIGLKLMLNEAANAEKCSPSV